MKATAGGLAGATKVVCWLLMTFLFVIPLNAEETPFLREQATLKSCLSCDISTNSGGFAAELFDGFSAERKDFWEEWRDEQSPDGKIEYDGSKVDIVYPMTNARNTLGIRSRERLATVPDKEGKTFLIRLDLDTAKSCSGALVLTPKISSTLFNRPQIRLYYLRDEKIGTFKLEIDSEVVGEFKVPCVPHYGVGLILSRKEVTALDPRGKVLLSAELPSWAAPGTSLYVWLCGIACPTLSDGRLAINSIRLRHPLTMRAASCLAWGFIGTPALDADFTSFDDKVWKRWAEGGVSSSVVTTSEEGLRFEVPGGDEKNKFGRYGVCTKNPIVMGMLAEREFTAIEMTIDTTFTSGARMALVTSPRDSIWATPHIRLGLERRGLVCEAWLGDEKSIAGRFQLPLNEQCQVTFLLGKWGAYVIGPDCGLRSVMPLPEWARKTMFYHLLIYSHAPRPREPASLGLRYVRVTNNCRTPVVQAVSSEEPQNQTTKTLQKLLKSNSVLTGPSSTVSSPTTE